MKQSSNSKKRKQKQSSSNDIHDELKQAPKEKVVTSIPNKKLRADSKERAKKRPLIQKIAKALTGSKDDSYRELIINNEPLETRVALLVDGVLEKFEVERTGENRMVSAVFAGKIQNLEPGLKAAFVDIGQEKNAFLHYWDILPVANDNTIEIVRQNESAEQKKRREAKVSLKDIPKHYPIGTDIVVQITKGQIGSKGPRTTTNIALPGRYIVLMPFSGQCGISRKIADRQERSRLKAIIQNLTLPEGMGIIVRTAGEGKKKGYFMRDLRMLMKTWSKIKEVMETSKRPCQLYEEPDLIERTIRDFLTESVDRVIIDSETGYQRVIDLVSEISKRSRRKITLFGDDIPVFERFNIEKQIEQTFQRRVPLPSGGEIVIEETEALVAIDVNTGSHRGKEKDGKDFILQANLEAASEAARQLRLRNIGGLIILDFIDMKNRRDRKAIYDRMRREMQKDKAKNNVLPISPLGIMQMTRQRHSESTSSGIYTSCPYCTGRGIVKSPRAMSTEIQRSLVSVIRHRRNSSSSQEGEKIKIQILLHPTNLERLRTEDEEHLIEIEEAYNTQLSFQADPSYHVENFKLLDAETGQELR